MALLQLLHYVATSNFFLHLEESIHVSQVLVQSNLRITDFVVSSQISATASFCSDEDGAPDRPEVSVLWRSLHPDLTAQLLPVIMYYTSLEPVSTSPAT